MKKRGNLLIILSIFIFALTLTSCGNSKYKLEEGSNLTKEDIKILKKNYNSLDEDQKIDLILMEDKMSENEYINFKDDLKRLYIQEMASIYSSEEAAVKSFEKEYDLKLREKQGELTEEEEKKNEKSEEEAKDSYNKIMEYVNAEDEIQNNLDNDLKNKYEEYTIKSEVVDSDHVNRKIIVDVNVITFKDITVGEMTSIRNEVAHEVQKVIVCNIIEIKLKLNSEDKGTYTFTLDNGWDKNIEP